VRHAGALTVQPLGAHVGPGRPASRGCSGEQEAWACWLWRLEPQHRAAWGGPPAGARLAPAEGNPWCSKIARTPAAVCPACNAKRAQVTAVHLVEQVLPHVPYRQWTLSFPHRVRWVLLKDAGLLALRGVEGAHARRGGAAAEEGAPASAAPVGEKRGPARAAAFLAGGRGDAPAAKAAAVRAARGLQPARQHAPACQARWNTRGRGRHGWMGRGCYAGRSRWTCSRAAVAGAGAGCWRMSRLGKGGRAILEHLGLPSQPPRLAPARGPPQSAGC
jgi:hypothetical protein